MAKVLYGLALVAVLIAILDLQAPPGSRAATEAGFLLLAAPLFALLGLWRSRAVTKLCPHCAERVRLEASKCKHCGSDI